MLGWHQAQERTDGVAGETVPVGVLDRQREPGQRADTPQTTQPVNQRGELRIGSHRTDGLIQPVPAGSCLEHRLIVRIERDLQDKILGAVLPQPEIVFLCSPNNPTGTWFDDATLERFIARVPKNVLVVVDEAYHEYVEAEGTTSALHLADRYPNLIITRTFSKAYALAGLRIGYLVAHPSVVAILERLRESFNVNSVALAGAEAALADRLHLDRARAFNTAERAWLAHALTTRGYDCLPSQTNFLLVDLGRDAAELERHLFECGVVVRPMAGYGLPQTLRISVGNRLENQRLLAALP